MTTINQTVLMSGAEHFRVVELNPYSHSDIQPDVQRACREHASIRQALTDAGVDVISTPAPPGCQDGVYTANWALCRGDTAVLSRLPPQRQAEEACAAEVLRNLGMRTVRAPFRFSGQGDALPCGNLLFCGSEYRTDQRMHAFLADTLGYDVVSLRTVPLLDAAGSPKLNRLTSWPDSFFYDIDLALAVLRPDLIAWCPEAFVPESQARIRALPLETIEVSLSEARDHFACNLLSTGDTVVMSAHAPHLRAAIEAHGMSVVTPDVSELAKGGGFIRCTTLTLDHP